MQDQLFFIALAAQLIALLAIAFKADSTRADVSNWIKGL